MRVWKWQKVGGTCKRGALVGGGGWGEEGGCRGSVGTSLLTPRELPAKVCGLRSRFPASEMAGGL